MEKLKSLLGKRRSPEAPESDALQGLVDVAMELAQRIRPDGNSDAGGSASRVFRDAHPRDGWELQSYVYEEEDDVSVTPHTVLGFWIDHMGRAKVVSTITTLDMDPDAPVGPCSNELWVLKNPSGVRYIVGGDHQGVIQDEEEIIRELKKKSTRGHTFTTNSPNV